MTEYQVLAGETLIGHSALEFGDPPMGVAFGKFLPLPAYSSIQSQCIASLDQAPLALSIAHPVGQRVPAVGVTILDYSAELGEIEVDAFGIGYPLYEELFPHHVAAYKQQFAQPEAASPFGSGVRFRMKTLAFAVGFLVAMAFAAPRIAATDSEPIGAEASLYLLGFLLVGMCATAFTLSVVGRSVPRGWLVAFCAGVSSSIFYSAAAVVLPALSLGTAVLTGSMASVLVA